MDMQALLAMSEAELTAFANKTAGAKAAEWTPVPKQAANVSDLMSQIAKNLALNENKTVVATVTLPKEFNAEFRNCERHGRYQINFQRNGNTYYTGGECPTCAEERKKHQEVERHVALLKDANIPPRFRACTFDNYRVEVAGQREAVIAAKAYADSFKTHCENGNSIIYRGHVGTGKNHLAIATAKQLLQAGFTVRLVKAQEFLDSYWGKSFAEREEYMQTIGKVDLLILDELGRSSTNKGAEDAFFRLIDSRYEQMKPTMLLSNLPIKDIEQIITPAGLDRLRQGDRAVINFDWGSYRADANLKQAQTSTTGATV